jgi:hypothetical protein
MYNIGKFLTLYKQPCVEFEFANIIRYIRGMLIFRIEYSETAKLVC